MYKKEMPEEEKENRFFIYEKNKTKAEQAFLKSTETRKSKIVKIYEVE